MNRFERVYFEHEGVLYKDFTLYAEKDSLGLKDNEQYLMLITDEIREKLQTPDSFITTTALAPKNSDIFIVPKCYYAANDVRKNYNIKKYVDTGDYNVFSESSYLSCSGYVYIRRLAFFPDEKLAFGIASSTKEDDMWKFISTLFNTLDRKNMIFYDDTVTFHSANCHPAYKMLLDGTLTKPCIKNTQLDLSGGEDLTMDALRLVLETGKVYYKMSDAKQNFFIQIQALNQYDWRHYHGTVGILIKLLKEHTHSIAEDVMNSPSQLNKTIREILSIDTCTPDNEKDLAMMQALIDDVLGLEGKKFVDIKNLACQCYKKKVPWECFYAVYDGMVRITHKNYVNENNN